MFVTISTTRKTKRARVNHCCDRESIKSRSKKRYQNHFRDHFILEDQIWHCRMIFLDEIAQINCIFKRMIKTLRLRNVDFSILKAKDFNKFKCRFIEIYIKELRIRDNRKCEHVSTQLFYFFLEIIHNIIVRLSWLREINSHVDWITLTWRCEIEHDRITFDFLENVWFEKIKRFLYTFWFTIKWTMQRETSNSRRCRVKFSMICSRTSTCSRKKIHFDSLSTTKKIMSSVFCLTRILLSIFCTTCQKKNLMYLREYIVKNKTLNQIREFINRASVSMQLFLKRMIILNYTLIIAI